MAVMKTVSSASAWEHQIADRNLGMCLSVEGKNLTFKKSSPASVHFLMKEVLTHNGRWDLITPRVSIDGLILQICVWGIRYTKLKLFRDGLGRGAITGNQLGVETPD